MTPEKTKSPSVKNPSSAMKVEAAKPVVPANVPLPNPPPMFRGADWLSFAITTLGMFLAYMYTLAPDLTLQDSGELAVGSYYAGVPHPPGYPVWTVYTWLFTVLLPFSNIAWRVAVSSAVAGALTCGLVAIMVSRGSSMLMEGIGEFKDIAKRWENEICVVTGLVAGALIGFDGFMWSQAVIVEVYTLTALSLVGVLVALMRWIYAPHQHRYLFLAWFIFGIAFNNHQSVLVCALPMVVVMAAVQPRLGRDALLGGFALMVLGLVFNRMGSLTTLNDNTPLMVIYCLIGLATGVAWVSLCVKNKSLGAVAPYVLGYVGLAIMLTVFSPTPAEMSGPILFLGVLAVAVAVAVGWKKKDNSFNWALICVLAFLVGALFYLYMAITSMTNPPMNWGYPRTVTGFIHAFTRGQYERIHPTTGTGTGLTLIWSFCTRFAGQLKMLAEGSLEELNLAYILVALVPFFFVKRMQARERAWLFGLGAFWVMMGPVLMLLFNPAPDRQSLSLIKVFFTPSHMFIAMGTGYGLTLLLAALATAYERFRVTGIITAIIIAGIALFGVAHTYSKTVYYLPRWASLLGLVLAVAVVVLLLASRAKAPVAALLAVFSLMPGTSVISHWSENEQRGHLFGFWFGHDMFTPPYKDKTGKPIYPEMAKDTVLYGGTDPGRFCPTYMIFDESFIAPKDRRDAKFDRRDVYIITQNALADGTYLNYIRAHYNRSAQIDPPFFSELVRSDKERTLNYKTNLLAKMALPLDNFFLTLGDDVEKRRRAGSSLFTESDFTDLASFAGKLKSGGAPATVSKFLNANLSPDTLQRLNGPADKALGKALARDLNHLMNAEYEANQRLPDLRFEYGSLTNELAGLTSGSREFKKKQERAAKVQQELADATKIVPFYNSPLFLVGEINDLPAFVGRLQSDTNLPLSQFIWSQFSAMQRQWLVDPTMAMRERQTHLAMALNRLLEGPSIYNPQRFAKVTLSDETRRLLEKNPTGSELVRLNRLLLESAYPVELTRAASVRTDRFSDFQPSDYVKRFMVQNPQLHSRIRLFRLMLEEAYPKEIAKSLGGVYPDMEIYSASNEDSQRCFQEYMADAQERMKKNQLQPGEDVRVVDNRVQVSGQVAVMAINGLLTKVIFDHNPNNEFYVEESFPLQWMYPHLSPYGIIMKINRQPVPELTQEMVDKDHDFWSQYSERLIGNWITYDTSITNICAFAEKTYVHHDYKTFKGDPRFVRDDDAQKAFSKLRSSIGGLYAWRIDNARSEPERQRALKEAEFAFKQAYAFCPYSPEALYRFVQILIRNGRIDEARLMAMTSQKLDPDNTGLDHLLEQIDGIKKQQQSVLQSQGGLQQLEAEYSAHPKNVTNALALAQSLVQLGQTDRVRQIADSLLTNAPNDPNAVYFAVQVYSQLHDTPKLEGALQRWAQVNPTPESWLDLAAMETLLNKQPQALAALRTCLDLNTRRLAANPKASNVALFVKTDERLKALQGLPEFQRLVGTNK